MNRLNASDRAQIIAALVEGASINTALEVLRDMGCACAAYHNNAVRNLRVRPGKGKNLHARTGRGAGNVWTWTAMDADTKLIISYMLGDRGPLQHRILCVTSLGESPTAFMFRPS
jgi:hypothetical protein